MRAVFIMGAGRSGTTLLGSILGAHPRCSVTPESQFVAEIYRDSAKDGFAPDDALKRIEYHERFKIWNLDISNEGIRKKLKYSKTYSELIFRIVDHYNRTIGKNDEFDLWIDHTPNNVERVDLLKAIYPDAKFIHLIRDARSVVASQKKLNWTKGNIVELSKYWITKISYGFIYQTKYPDNVITIKYEDLVLDTERTLKKITKFIGIEYDEKMLEANGFIVPEYTRHQHKLVGKIPEKSRVDSWRRELKSREIEIIEYYTGSVLEILGYEMVHKKPIKPKIHEKALFFLEKQKKRIAKKVSK